MENSANKWREPPIGFQSGNASTDALPHILVPLLGRVNKILHAVGNSELEVNVKTPDARYLLNGFEKIANRVTADIILAG